MTTTLKQKMASLPARQRKKVEARAKALIAEELSLRELRKAHELTQESIAKKLGMTQDGISRLENRSDLLLSTLRGFVEAMGGTLNLIVEFPNRPPVTLSGLALTEAMPISRSAVSKRKKNVRRKVHPRSAA